MRFSRLGNIGGIWNHLSSFLNINCSAQIVLKEFVCKESNALSKKDHGGQDYHPDRKKEQNPRELEQALENTLLCCSQNLVFFFFCQVRIPYLRHQQINQVLA